LKGWKVDTSAVETRVSKEGNIVEYKLEDSAGTDLGEFEGGVKGWLKGAKSRVDVILDPHCMGEWYPLKERTRKMAPQFKSNGVGYIRLGDDMSKNGVAFLR